MVACEKGGGARADSRDGGGEAEQIYRARLKSCGGVVFVGVASVLRPLPEHAADSAEIAARKRDSPRLPSGRIRISSGDKAARDSVHRSWTSRISFLLATRRNHRADAFVDDSRTLPSLYPPYTLVSPEFL